MPFLSSAPKIPTPPAPSQSPNSTLTAQAQQVAKRQGQAAAVLTSPRGVTQRGTTMTHRLTGD